MFCDEKFFSLNEVDLTLEKFEDGDRFSSLGVCVEGISAISIDSKCSPVCGPVFKGEDNQLSQAEIWESLKKIFTAQKNMPLCQCVCSPVCDSISCSPIF